MEIGSDKRQTTIDRQLEHSTQLADQAQNLLQRLSTIVDRLAGAEPEAPAEATKQPEAVSGALGELQGNLFRVANLQRSMVELVARLERHV